LAGNGWVGVKWIPSSRGNLSYLRHPINFKTFDELGVAKKFAANCNWFTDCTGYCRYFDDGSPFTVAVSQKFSGTELPMSVLN
jgi:hypothetical protein